MEQRIISQDGTKIICYIKENTYAYYLIIPTSKKVNLLLNIVNNITDETIKQIKSYPDKASIFPIIDQNILLGVSQNQAESFQTLDNTLSEIINSSYQLLTYNHLEIDNNILLNKVGQYQTFYNWFINKYNGRVQLAELELIEKKEPQPQVQNTPTPPPTPTTPQVQEQDGPIEEQESKSLGFVSYVLLGVVAAIASLIFLYLIL